MVEATDTNLVKSDISEPSETGSYILKRRLTICSSNFFAKILLNTCKISPFHKCMPQNEKLFFYTYYMPFNIAVL